jgi:hypothetical protein
LLACPAFVAAFFGISVAIVEVRGDTLRYKRFFRWRTIREDEIAGVRRESPALASMRLNRFVLPWGRLYFALDRPFRAGKYPLLNYICGTKDRTTEEPMAAEAQTSANTSLQENRNVGLKQASAAAVGALSYCLTRLFLPSGPVPQRVAQSPLVEIPFRLVNLLANFEVQLVFAVVFTFLAVYRRSRRDAWIYAFVAGRAVPYVIFHWLGLG